MSYKAATALAALILSAQPIWADVTPDDVWLSWQNLAQSQGQKVTADSAVTEGDSLVLKGLKLTLGTDGSATFDQITLTDTGDGTVAITVPDSFPVQLILPKETPEAAQAEADLTVTAPGADITASGVPAAINYEKHLPKLEVVAKGKQGDGQSDITLKMTEVTGKYLAEAAEVGQTLSGAFAAKALDLAAAAKGADGQDVNLKLTLSDLDGKVDLTGVPADNSVDLDVALASGMTFDAALSYGIGALNVTGTDAGKPMTVAGTLSGGSLTMAMDANKFHYDAVNRALSLNLSGTDRASGGDFTFAGSMADFSTGLDIQGQNWSKGDDFGLALKDGLIMAGSGGLGSTNIDFAGGPADKPVRVKVALAGAKSSFTLGAAELTSDLGATALTATVSSPDLPVPEVTLDLADLAFSLLMPVAKSGKPAPFAFLTKIVDLKLPDALWSMVDPAGSLSHDPASLIIDTKGTATITRDLMQDVAALEAGSGEAPGVLNSIDIPQILARAAGAEVTGKGGFTFDPTDTQTFGMPLPTGKIDLRGTGLNGLLDKLVTLGVMQAEEAMQARMGLSMFAKNDMAKDEITTTLEFRDKHFFANGAQMQ